MARKKKISDELNNKSTMFINKIEANMRYKADTSSNALSFDWITEFEFACPYIDNVVRNPKVALINEEEVVKIGKAKKISVASVKDLSRHTGFIDKIDDTTGDVQPSKILMVHPEETFNTYENRFIFTLFDDMKRFLRTREDKLNDFEIDNDKILEYAASTLTDEEKIDIELKITSRELPKDTTSKSYEKEIKEAKLRIKKIKDYFSSWERSEFIKSLTKERAIFVTAPLQKTNLILKNPNFQIATRLWDYIRKYDDENSNNEGIDTTGDDILKSLLNDSFLMDYYVLDSISSRKRDQKKKLADYAMVMIRQQIQRVISLLLNSGVKISEEEILSMITNEINNEKSKILVGKADVKKKFKNIMDEYIEQTQDYL